MCSNRLGVELYTGRYNVNNSDTKKVLVRKIIPAEAEGTAVQNIQVTKIQIVNVDELVTYFIDSVRKS